MYIPNDDKQNDPFCRLRLLVEKFEHCLFEMSKLKFYKC